MSVLAVAVAALLAGGAGASDPEAVLYQLTDQDVIEAAKTLGWKIGEAGRTIEGGFTRILILSNGAPITVAGVECEGQPSHCTAYDMRLLFGGIGPERIAKAKIDMQYNYAEPLAYEGLGVEIYRAQFLNGGVTRKHLELSLQTFGEIALDASKKAFPCGLPVEGREPDCTPAKPTR